MRFDAVSIAAVAASLASPAMAFWRLPCQGRLGVAPMDPLVNPGTTAHHVHAIHGASNFAMSVSSALLEASDCTSCAVTQDKSIYWTPTLYFVHNNGSSELVDQVGGTLVYYLPRGENVKAFPKGFRLLAGDTYNRNFTLPVPDPPKSSWTEKQKTQHALRQKSLGFNCLNYGIDGEPALYRHGMPDKEYLDAHCSEGIRAEIMFPSCWNGKDLDSDDHMSHMAYPDLVDDGKCPEGFEQRLVSLMYETIWNTNAFKEKDGEFVWANGDPTGYGYHADFINGWEDDVLDRAVKECRSESGLVADCPVFNLQSLEKQNECVMDIPSLLAEKRFDFCEEGLPGDVPILYGPGYAKHADPEDSAQSSSVALPTVSYTPAPSLPPAPPTTPPAPPKPTSPAAFYPSPSSTLEDLMEKPSTTAPPPSPMPTEGILRTTTYTKGNTVYEVAIYQDVVTETVEVDPTPAPAANRRRHAHGRRH